MSNAVLPASKYRTYRRKAVVYSFRARRVRASSNAPVPLVPEVMVSFCRLALAVQYQANGESGPQRQHNVIGP
jgi:hypothetical protein